MQVYCRPIHRIQTRHALYHSHRASPPPSIISSPPFVSVSIHVSPFVCLRLFLLQSIQCRLVFEESSCKERSNIRGLLSRKQMERKLCTTSSTIIKRQSVHS